MEKLNTISSLQTNSVIESNSRSTLIPLKDEPKLEKQLRDNDIISNNNENTTFLLPNNDLFIFIRNEKEFKSSENEFLNTLIKPTDGWVSRNLNRPVSLTFSKYLTRLNISPDLITYITLIIGILNSILFCFGGYYPLMIGSFMFHATSVLDGVDGELARLEYKSSERGEWLDTFADNLIYITSLIGLVIGIYRNNPSDIVFYSGIISAIIVILALLSLYLYLLRQKKGGSLVSVEYSFEKGNTKFDEIMRYAAALGKRDFFALFFFFMGVLGILHYSLIYIGIVGLFVLAFSIHSHLKVN
ncbi:MAG: CDP-alcohol phosphatidyltransferase family protein [Flavobacteriales bacterium]